MSGLGRMKSVDEVGNDAESDEASPDTGKGRDAQKKMQLGSMFLDAIGGDDSEDEDVGHFSMHEGGHGLFVPDLHRLAGMRDFAKVQAFVNRVEEQYAYGSPETSPEVSPVGRSPTRRRSSMGSIEDPLLGINRRRIINVDSPKGDGTRVRRPSSADPGTPRGDGMKGMAAVVRGVGKFGASVTKKRTEADVKNLLDGGAYSEFADLFLERPQTDAQRAAARKEWLMTWWATCRIQANVRGWVQKARFNMLRHQNQHLPLDLRMDMAHNDLDYETTKAKLEEAIERAEFERMFQPMTQEQRYIVARFAIEDPEIDSKDAAKMLRELLQGKHVSQHHFITLLNISIERGCLGKTALASLMTQASKNGWVTGKLFEDMVYDGIRHGFDFRPHLAKLLRKAYAGGAVNHEVFTRLILHAVEKGIVSEEQMAGFARELEAAGHFSREMAQQMVVRAAERAKATGRADYLNLSGSMVVREAMMAGYESAAVDVTLDRGRKQLLKNKITRTSGLCLGPVANKAPDFLSPFMTPRSWQVSVRPPGGQLGGLKLKPARPPGGRRRRPGNSGESWRGVEEEAAAAAAADMDAMEADLRRQIDDLQKSSALQQGGLESEAGAGAGARAGGAVRPDGSIPGLEGGGGKGQWGATWRLQEEYSYEHVTEENSLTIFAEHSLENFPSVSETISRGMFTDRATRRARTSGGRSIATAGASTGGPRPGDPSDPAYGVTRREVRQILPRGKVRSYRDPTAPKDQDANRREERSREVGLPAVLPPSLDSARSRPLTKGGQGAGLWSRGGHGGLRAPAQHGEAQVFTVEHESSPEKVPSPPPIGDDEYELRGGVGTRGGGGGGCGGGGGGGGGRTAGAASGAAGGRRPRRPPATADRGRTPFAVHTYSFRRNGLRTPGKASLDWHEPSGLIAHRALMGESVSTPRELQAQQQTLSRLPLSGDAPSSYRRPPTHGGGGGAGAQGGGLPRIHTAGGAELGASPSLTRLPTVPSLAAQASSTRAFPMFPSRLAELMAVSVPSPSGTPYATPTPTPLFGRAHGGRRRGGAVAAGGGGRGR